MTSSPDPLRAALFVQAFLMQRPFSAVVILPPKDHVQVFTSLLEGPLVHVIFMFDLFGLSWCLDGKTSVLRFHHM